MSLKTKLNTAALLPIKFFGTVKKHGFKESLKRVQKFTKQKLNIKPKPTTYNDYLKLRSAEISRISLNDLENLKYQPTVTFFVISRNSTKALDSIHRQIYKNLEFITLETLDEIYTYIHEIQSDYFSVINAADEIFEDYLFELVKNINENKDADLIYFDEEFVNSDQERIPFFKPDFSLDTFTAASYFGHPLFKTSAVLNLQNLDTIYSQVIEWDFALRLAETGSKIVHISKVLYSNFNKSLPGKDSFNNQFTKESLKLISEFTKRNKIEAEVESGIWSGSVYIKRKIKDQNKKVSIIIPTKNNWEILDKCIKSIEEKSDYKNYEIIILNNNSDDPESLKYFKKSKYIVLDLPIPFNFAKLNNEGFKVSKGEYVLFLNNDMEVISSEWLDALVEQVQRKEVGMAGAKLLYPDNTIQHAGLVMGIHGIAAHGMKYLHDDDNGYFGQANIIREVSAVTGAAIMMRSEVFKEVGMFNEDYTIAFNDLDLCMKVKDKGYKIIYTPYSKLYHYESKTRGKIPQPIEYHEGAMFINKWGNIVHAGDPFYNKNLTLEKEDFSLR